MSALSDALENSLINHLVRGTAYTPPATLYFSLHTASPGEIGAAYEVGAGGYARVAVANNATNFGVAAGLAKTNSTDIIFPEATGAWGTPTHWAVYDAILGNLLISGTLTSPRSIAIGDTPKIAANTMQVSFSSISGGVGLSPYAKDKLLDLVFGGYAFASPAAVYAAAGTNATTAAFAEWADTSYARQAITFSAPSSGSTSNSGVVTISNGVSSNTGPLTTFQIFDSSTVGNALVSGPLSASRSVPVGDTAKFAVGSISLILQ